MGGRSGAVGGEEPMEIDCACYAGAGWTCFTSEEGSSTVVNDTPAHSLKYQYRLVKADPNPVVSHEG